MATEKLQLFENRKIRSVWDEDKQEWYFSIQDVVEALTESVDVEQYIKRMLSRDEQLKLNWGTICTLLEMTAADGKHRKVQAADLGGIFRLIQSIQFRKELTDQWKKSDVKDEFEYAILINLMTKEWAGKTVAEYKKFKGLKKESLRDNMTGIELALNILAEASATEISKTQKPKGFYESKDVAMEGAKIAKEARKNIEKRTGKSAVSSKNAKSISGRMDNILELSEE